MNAASAADVQSGIAAIVLCAGQGTRMKSALPKAAHLLLGKPLSSYPLRRALEAGASRAVAVTGHGADQVETALRGALGGLMENIAFARQAQQLGTAHAVLSAKDALEGFSGSLFILNGDVPLVTAGTLRALVQAKRDANSPLALVTTVPPSPAGYGRILRDAHGRMQRIVEHRDATAEELKIGEINAGLYLADAGFLWRSLARLDRNNAQNELYLTDLAAIAYGEGTPAVTVEAPFDEVGGVNDRAELARAAAALQARINRAHQLEGVTLELPETILIDETVTIGRDVTIGPNVRLAGKTVISGGAVIGQGAVITDSVIGSGTEILPYSVLESAAVGNNAKIGPFARLRPGTELANSVHVGNFVETKKTRIGEGSKANHLSYLGDCTIGSGTNIGAGTITCNYDGLHKHQTIIGDGVFVGSDSQFVAPVTVGDNALIGAGSTIVADIPKDSLAIARGRQVTKKDYMKGKKPGAL